MPATSTAETLPRTTWQGDLGSDPAGDIGLLARAAGVFDT